MENDFYLSKLNLINFKNFRQVDLLFSPGINCFIGKNGVGKTNILDAVYYLSMCKSYLNLIDSQNILFGEQFFVVQSEWERRGVTEQIYCGVKKGQKKVVKKNKVIYEKLSEHIGQFPVVMISPYDSDLIIEGSEIRRKWLDSIIAQFDKDFLNHLVKYTKIINQRNALLKNGNYYDNDSLGIWDQQLVKFGNVIHKIRNKGIEEFIPIFRKYHKWLSGSNEEVGLRYRSQLFETPFEELLQNAREDDSRKQFTTVGVHKDDFVFTIKNNFPIKKFGSQGQQKTYLIALKLAQYEWVFKRLNLKPILLLDDIFDKLDNERVEKLMQMVSNGEFGQVIITDTDRQRISTIFEENNIKHKVFILRENNVFETLSEAMCEVVSNSN